MELLAEKMVMFFVTIKLCGKEEKQPINLSEDEEVPAIKVLKMCNMISD